LIIISNTFIQEWRGHTVKETNQLVENVLEVDQFTENVKNSPAVQNESICCRWCCYITVEPETRVSENGIS
jgi:hypothetical protein